MFEEHKDRRRANRAFDDGEGVTRYRMQQKAVSFGNDYWIDNPAGDHLYKVNGKVLRMRKTWKIEDRNGRNVATVKSRPLRIKDTMEVEDADGNRIALIKKALISPLRERWTIETENGEDLTVQGNIADHEYDIERDGYKVAEVSKRWFRFRDTYGLDISSDTDHTTVLAAAVAIDAMTHN